MKQRGRKSAASTSAIVVDLGRPGPPGRLSAEEAESWRKIVARMPAEWFSDESLHLLELLVAHIRSASMYGAELRRMKSIRTDEELERFKTLTRLHEIETRQVASLSAKMRLSQQARYIPKTAGRVFTRGTETETPLWDA